MQNVRKLSCPYCGSRAELRRGKELFGPNARTPTMYVCTNYPACDAYVSADTKGNPLGTLANKTLRGLRVQAHRAFDQLWHSGYMTREWAYKWLSIRLEISEQQCHIGQFTEKSCQQTIDLCHDAWSKRQKEGSELVC